MVSLQTQPRPAAQQKAHPVAPLLGEGRQSELPVGAVYQWGQWAIQLQNQGSKSKGGHQKRHLEIWVPAQG